ncbi:hypothetical protein LguiB_018308 [Lonicera macranthoides]
MASEGDEYHHNGRWKYDVFLSFRGEDIRKTFIDHLYSALERSCIYTFKDDEKLERGESISPALLKAIEESMIAVVVFSENYASSRWCLDELVKIMDCRRRRCGSSSSSSSSNSSSMKLGSQTVVIPIFYHVDPSNVRKPEEGYFGEKIIKQHDPAKVEMWRQALEEAANLSGYDLRNIADGHEAKCIDIFVKDIWKKLPDTISSEDERLVGMESRIEKVTSLLDVESDAVRFVGIWGMGGIGKTTLAKAVFSRMKNRFQAACYVEEFGEKSKKHGLRHLGKQLANNLKINNDCDGDKIMRRLRFKSVLLVLDGVYDVDDIDQLEVFVGKLRLFGPGSKIIITTRNRRTLVMHGVDKIYEAKLLNDGEAIRLFSRMAFKRIHPTKELEHLSYEVIHYANGLPLALKVLGSQLYGENMAFWEASLEKLRKEGPDGDILKKLKIGFDDLDREVQDTFLDVACFFEGQGKKYVTRILDSFGFYPNRSIPLLVYKSLIYVSIGNTLHMHNLIREMGRCIDREKPRRLWLINDFEDILKYSTGAENIEGILLHPQTCEVKCIDMATEVFRKMPKVRLLVVRNVRAHRAPKYLPSSLKWLIWDKFPSESLPRMFEAYNIVGLELPGSNIKRLWARNETMGQLKYIDLSFSPLMKTTPDFTSTPNLEVLNLRCCWNLEVVHPSLGALERLVHVDLRCCENLKTLPNSIRSKSLKTFSMWRSKKIKNFPEISVIMEHLLELDLSGTAIRELPSPIENFPNLVVLDLYGCKNIRSLPRAIYKLKCLRILVLSGCSELDELHEELGNLERLQELYLNGIGIKEVPSSIEHLRRLNSLCLSNCKNLRSLPSAICKLKSLKFLRLSGCSKLEKLPEELGSLDCLVELHLGGTAITQPPLSIRCLNNLNTLSFNRSSQSSNSTFQFLFTRKRKRQKDDSTRSLVLLSVSGLCSLVRLDLPGCIMLDGAIPSHLESLCYLKELNLQRNYFVELPSLDQLSRLENLYLDGCKMLEALPELPSSIIELTADDCPSLRLSVDRFTNCRKLCNVSLKNCLQLLKEDNGESKNIAMSTLWHHMTQRRQLYNSLELDIVLPGGDISEWFGKPTTGHSILLKLPTNWSRNFKGCGLCVAFDPRFKARPFTFFGTRKKVLGVLEIIQKNCNNHQHLRGPYTEIFRKEVKNISMEHVYLYYVSFTYLGWHCLQLNDCCEVEVSFETSIPNIVGVSQWGMVLVPKSP